MAGVAAFSPPALHHPRAEDEELSDAWSSKTFGAEAFQAPTERSHCRAAGHTQSEPTTTAPPPHPSSVPGPVQL